MKKNNKFRRTFRFKGCLVLAGIFAVLFSAVPPAFAKDEDFGIWNTYDIEKKFHKDWMIKAGEELRFREGVGLHYFDTHVGVAYRALEFLTLGVDYLQAREKKVVKDKEKWVWEERPRIYATLHHAVYGFMFDNRNMVEFRIKEDAVDSLRYRGLVGVLAPYQWTPLKFQPYVTNEFFFETHRSGLVQDRLIGGFKLKIYNGLGGTLYYMRQFEKSTSGRWSAYNILGLGLNYSF